MLSSGSESGGKLARLGITIEVTPFPRRNGMSSEQTQCSAVKDVVPLCFTPNGLIGLLLEPIFLPVICCPLNRRRLNSSAESSNAPRMGALCMSQKTEAQVFLYIFQPYSVDISQFC